jgi:hypothetical protein
MTRQTVRTGCDECGGRVIRQKADIASSVDDIVQDLYIAGGYERRGVQLQDELGQPVSIYCIPSPRPVLS